MLQHRRYVRRRGRAKLAIAAIAKPALGAYRTRDALISSPVSGAKSARHTGYNEKPAQWRRRSWQRHILSRSGKNLEIIGREIGRSLRRVKPHRISGNGGASAELTAASGGIACCRSAEGAFVSWLARPRCEAVVAVARRNYQWHLICIIRKIQSILLNLIVIKEIKSASWRIIDKWKLGAAKQ